MSPSFHFQRRLPNYQIFEQVTDGSGSVFDTKDILQGSLGLEQPNDIRQAMFLVSELLLNPSA